MSKLNKDGLQIGQLLHMRLVYSNYIAAVTKKFDSFMIIEYNYSGMRMSREIYYTDNAIYLEPIMLDGRPVLSKKNVFGKYKLKLP